MQKSINGNSRAAIIFFWGAIITFQIDVFQVLSQQVDQNINKIRTVIIDAGHGGKDTGAIGENSKEKDIALAISLKLGKYIEEKIPDVKVVYTRTTDVHVPLYERAKIANDNDADLFISIHINSSPNPAASGTESLVLGLHRSNENFEVAKRENQVILLEEDYKVNYEGFDPNSEESYIMFNLMQYIYDEHSISFADAVQYQFRERAGRKDRGVKRQGLLVLAQTGMPGILIEAGFISNKNEEQYMLSDEGQDYLASAIFRAFRQYKEQLEKISPTLLTDDNNSENITSMNQTATNTTNSSAQTENTETKIIISQESEIQDNQKQAIFKVQILFSENKLDINSQIFRDFNEVEEIISDGKYKYVVGSKTNYTEALEYSKWVKNRYPDAFIVAVSNGKILPLSEVLKEN